MKLHFFTWLIAIAVGVPISPANAGDNGIRSDWQTAYKSRARLLAGHMANQSGKTALYAGVQLELLPKWKTYWRSPGEAGGVPPTFGWAASKNVDNVEVDFPAPVRLVSEYGANIGYQSEVTFPIRFEVVDTTKPVILRVDFHYGICDDICVPANVNLVLAVPPNAAPTLPTVLSDAISRVPRRAPKLSPGDPNLKRADLVLTGKAPHLSLDIDYGRDAVSADVFVEGPGGIFIPMSQRVRDAKVGAGVLRFIVDLSKDVDIAEIKGKTLRVTAVDGQGQSEFSLPVE